jgi:hypothetical protein
MFAQWTTVHAHSHSQKGLPVGNFTWYSMSIGAYFHQIFTGHLLFLNFIGRKYSFIPTVEPYKPAIYLTFLMFVTAVSRNIEFSECLHSVI